MSDEEEDFSVEDFEEALGNIMEALHDVSRRLTALEARQFVKDKGIGTFNAAYLINGEYYNM